MVLWEVTHPLWRQEEDHSPVWVRERQLRMGALVPILLMCSASIQMPSMLRE